MVNGYEIHQENPDKDCQSERRDQIALTVKSVLDARIDEIDDDFDKRLHLARLVR